MIIANSGVDFAVVAFFLFLAFFVSLIFYLRREDRREGYPVEEESSGNLRAAGGFAFTANPKIFRLPFDRGTVTVPNHDRDRRELALRRTSVAPGSPLEPTGNPMIDGVGPASYAARAKVPDLTYHGEPKIVPMSMLPDFVIARGDPDPRGMLVIGADRAIAGTVDDLWIDRGEAMIRYLQLAPETGGPSVLLPITMCRINKQRRQVKVDAITAAQFTDVPLLESADQITFDEEERIVAYYGGGFLYATPHRTEPLL